MNIKEKPPIYKGVLKMFPLALVEVAKLSMIGSKKWGYSLSKEKDFRDSTARHLTKGELKQVAWNALAALEKDLMYKKQKIEYSKGHKLEIHGKVEYIVDDSGCHVGDLISLMDRSD